MNTLEQFFIQKFEKDQERVHTVDWAARKEKWIAALEQLYETIEAWLRPSVEKGLIRIDFIPKIMEEENIGQYEVKKMKLWVGTEQVVFDPKGTILIGSYGRVDMTGDDGAVMLLLFEWEKWEFAIRTPSLRRWPLTEESFSDALKEVMRK